MEIPPSSSFAQSTALFSDLSHDAQMKSMAGVFPTEPYNKHIYSGDITQAVSHTGLDKEFRTSDLHEAHRIFNGALQYPFQDKAQIFHHKFDPSYWDGSELDGDYNIQENLIGTPLGASTLEDPRLSYVKNMLIMKEMHGANDPLSNDYIKDLYMINAEKGSNYYQNQLSKLEGSMANYSRTNRYINHKPLAGIAFTQSVATGNPVHYKHTANKAVSMPSGAGTSQQSRRQERFNRLNTSAPYQIKDKLIVPRHDHSRDHGGRNMSDDTIILPYDGYERREGDSFVVDDTVLLAGLGSTDVIVTPHNHEHEGKHASENLLDLESDDFVSPIKDTRAITTPDLWWSPTSPNYSDQSIVVPVSGDERNTSSMERSLLTGMENALTDFDTQAYLLTSTPKKSNQSTPAPKTPMSTYYTEQPLYQTGRSAQETMSYNRLGDGPTVPRRVTFDSPKNLTEDITPPRTPLTGQSGGVSPYRQTRRLEQAINIKNEAEEKSKFLSPFTESEKSKTTALKYQMSQRLQAMQNVSASKLRDRLSTRFQELQDETRSNAQRIFNL